MKNKIILVNVPFLNPGVTFNTDELNLRAQKFIAEIKVLVPKIQYLLCDLEYELFFDKEHIWLIIFLFKQAQLLLPMLSEVHLNEAKLEIVDELKRLPPNLNCLALETFSVESFANYIKDVDEEKIKQLMKKKKNETVKFMLEDEDISFGFPEMAPYVIDRTIRTIQFNIEYIHSDYFKIKLLTDSLDNISRKKTTFLKVKNKIFDDEFFFNCVEVLRSKPKKLMALEAYCLRDSVTNNILMYQLV